jgi:hypothetical protein
VAPFHLVALAESALRDAACYRRAGCVVNISSHAGIRPKGASIPYAVVVMLVESDDLTGEILLSDGGLNLT